MKISGKRDPEYLARKRAREEAARGKPTRGFANVSTLEGIEEAQVFELPRGSGRIWRIDPIPHTTGARITELELELAAIHMEHEAIVERQSKSAGADLPAMQKLSAQWANVVQRGAKIAGPLMIPVGKGKWKYRVLKAVRRWKNPLLDKPAQDVAWVIGFLARCQMTYQSQARHLVGVTVSRN